MTSSRSYLFNDAKLRERALLEFARAIRTGRMIAFTGSYATVPYGYPNWTLAVSAYLDEAITISRDKPRGATLDWSSNTFTRAIENLNSHLSRKVDKDKDANADVEKTVLMTIAEEALRAIDERFDLCGEDSRLKRLRDAWAGQFKLRDVKADELDLVPYALVRDLGIRRFVTLNYDLEHEIAILKLLARVSPNKTSSDKVDATSVLRVHRPEVDRATNALTFSLPGGLRLTSDVFDRERTDRLIEFAVGSPDDDYQVLHLHGRAEGESLKPVMSQREPMIVSYRDYDRLYRRGGLSKQPFEHALRILYSGNPVVFVGVGMTEVEVNRTLQEFVSNQPSRRVTSTFLLWNTPNLSNLRDIPNAKAAMRLDWLHRLGVLTIFDDELTLANVDLSSYASKSRDEITHDRHKRTSKHITNIGVEASARMNHEAAHTTPGAGGTLKTDNLESVKWRSVTRRLHTQTPDGAEIDPVVSLWGRSQRPDLPGVDDPPSKIGDGSNLCVEFAPNGWGKGSRSDRLAHTLHQQLRDRKAKGEIVARNPVAIINSGYCFDTDVVLSSWLAMPTAS